MARIPHPKQQAAASMQQVKRKHVLAVVLGAGMVVLSIVPALLGMAIQQRVIAPPQLDVQLGGLHLLAATTRAQDCDGYVTPCQVELMEPAQDFYVIWLLTHARQSASPGKRWTGSRLLRLRLRN